MPTQLFFFFPYRGIGGVSLLFLRIATAIRRLKPDLRITLIDYPDGYMAKNLKDPTIALMPLKPNTKIRIPSGSVVVVQSLPLWRLPPELQFAPDAKLFMWHLHPLNIAPGSYSPHQQSSGIVGQLKSMLRTTLYAAQTRQFARLLREADAQKSLAFMDSENLEIAQLANNTEIPEPRFIPVPTIAQQTAPLRELKSETFRCGWVGRLEGFKLPILEYTMHRVAKFSSISPKPVTFAIIGSGDGAEHLRLVAERLEKENHKIRFHFTGQVHHDELDQLMFRSLDILFAMGTSALEGAKLGIPTILLDFSYEPIACDYVFRLIHQTSGFTLGRLIRNDMIVPGNTSLETIFHQIMQHPEDVSRDCREYFERNHAIDIVRDKFLKAINECSFTYGQATELKLTKLDPVLRIYFGTKRLLTGWDYRVPSI